MREVALCVGAVVLLFGCSGSATVSSQDSSHTFVRMVDPFSVISPSGDEYDHPFLGGLNAPRPQFIDIDGDSDLDLFVQETSDQLVFFENIGSAEVADYVWRTDHYQNLETGDWFRFADLDLDGDLDLLSEQKYSLVRYYKNTGSATNPTFVIAADTLRDVDGAAIFSDRQNIPFAQDIDCDDKVDLFIGLLIGSVMRYELDHYDDNRVPIFRKLTERFEDIEIVGDLQGSRHGANTLTFNDIDRDGDLDLFWGDFFEEGILLVRNTGSCRSPILRSEPIQYPVNDPVLTSGYNAPMFADLNNDGREELFVGVVGGAFNATKSLADNFYFLEQIGEGSYRTVSSRFISAIDLGSESIVTLVDIDVDGDLDFTVTNKIDPLSTLTANLSVFKNTGTTTDPVYTYSGDLDVDDSYHYSPTFGDMDNDGDVDLVLGTWNEGMLFYRNVGTKTNPEFRKEDHHTVELTRGGNSTPVLVDIDADGDLDLFAGESSGTINQYINNGTAGKHQFVLVTDELNGIDIGRRSVPSFADYDNDGDYDLFVGTDSEGIIRFENTGTAEAPRFAEGVAVDINVDQFSNVSFGDINGDGLDDILSGGLGGGVRYFQGVSRP